MAIVLILIVVATVVTKKVPFNFVLLIVPAVCALILGHSVEETSTFIVGQLSSMMESAGFMLLFAFLYFQMLTEAGVFDTIVTAVTTKLGSKMNVIVIMVLTTLIGGFSILTGNFTPAYLITFPILVPLYKKFDFDREAAFIIAQTAMSALCFIPWGIGIAPYFVFIVTTVVTAMINYPKDFGRIFAKVGPMYLNILVMLIAINVYQAVFNNTGMVGAISDALMQFCPAFLLRYIHIILLLLCVVIIYVIPFQIFNALYPIFISIGAGFGIPAVAVIAPFVCNLSLATSSTPTNSSTYTGCALTETDVQHYCKKAVPVQTVTNAIVVLTAVLFGVLQL